MNTPRPKKDHPRYVSDISEVLAGDTIVAPFATPNGRSSDRVEVLDFDPEYGILTTRGWVDGNDILDILEN
jgi:hypothetical protein